MRKKILFAVTSILLAVFVVAFSWGAREMARNQRQIEAMIAIRGIKNLLLINLLDAETGQRGYLIIHRSDYLDPYTHAIVEVPKLLASIESVAVTDRQKEFVRNIEPLITRKLAEMGETISLYHHNDMKQALVVIATDEGQRIMNEIRTRFAAERTYELGQIAEDVAETDRIAYWMIFGIIGILGLLVAVTVMLRGTAERIVYVETHAPRYHDDLDPNAKLDAIIERFRAMSNEI